MDAYLVGSDDDDDDDEVLVWGSAFDTDAGTADAPCTAQSACASTTATCSPPLPLQLHSRDPGSPLRRPAKRQREADADVAATSPRRLMREERRLVEEAMRVEMAQQELDREALLVQEQFEEAERACARLNHVPPHTPQQFDQQSEAQRLQAEEDRQIAQAIAASLLDTAPHSATAACDPSPPPPPPPSAPRAPSPTVYSRPMPSRPLSATEEVFFAREREAQRKMRLLERLNEQNQSERQKLEQTQAWKRSNAAKNDNLRHQQQAAQRSLATEDTPPCQCGYPSIMFVSKKGKPENIGRRFVTCSKKMGDPDKCRFFEWMDPPLTLEQQKAQEGQAPGQAVTPPVLFAAHAAGARARFSLSSRR